MSGPNTHALKPAAAVSVKTAVHGDGRVAGLGFKPADLPRLYRALLTPEGKVRASSILLQVAQKVAEGKAPVPGKDGWIEYPKNHRGLPFHQLADLEPNSKQVKRTVVYAGEVLGVLHAPVAPKKGTSVLGEDLPANGKPASIAITEVAGSRTVVEDGTLVAECDGLCEEDADGTLRVIPEIVLSEVSETTGRVPESGVSEANVVVTGDVKGQGIATTENVFIGARPEGGALEGKSPVQAKNLIVDAYWAKLVAGDAPPP